MKRYLQIIIIFRNPDGKMCLKMIIYLRENYLILISNKVWRSILYTRHVYTRREYIISVNFTKHLFFFFFTGTLKFLMHTVSGDYIWRARCIRPLYYIPLTICIAFTTSDYYILENYVLPLPPIKLSVNKDDLS